MAVLFMMPVWKAPSEVWLQRMMEALGNDLDTVISYNTEGATTWKGMVRAVALNPWYSHIPYVTRAMRMVGVSVSKVPEANSKVLLREINRPTISKILCHFGTFAVNFMDVWRLIDIPIFVHFHGYDATFDLRQSDQPETRSFGPEYIDQILELSNYATFIANSEYTKGNLVAIGVPEDRVVVKYIGVPLTPVTKEHTSKTDIRILHLGRLIDCKSPDRTIMAFERARREGLDGELWIAGDGPMRLTCELMKVRSQFRDSIQILGAVSSENAEQLLKDADIFTQHNIFGEISRQSESFGVSIIEAMAHGLPVIGTRHGGVVETVIHGVTGTLIEPGDFEAQADVMIRYANDPQLRQKIGNQARKYVEEHFGLEQERYRLRSILGLDTV